MKLLSFLKKQPLPILYADGTTARRFYFWKKPEAIVVEGVKVALKDAPDVLIHEDARAYAASCFIGGTACVLPTRETAEKMARNRSQINQTAAFLRENGVDADDLELNWYWTSTPSTLPSEREFYFIKFYMNGARMPNFEKYPYRVRPVSEA